MIYLRVHSEEQGFIRRIDRLSLISLKLLLRGSGFFVVKVQIVSCLLEQSSVGDFPLASPLPITDTSAPPQASPLPAGKTLGIRLNFSAPGKFLLGNSERGGGMGHCLRRESALFGAPPRRGSRGGLKAALLPAGDQHSPPSPRPGSHSTTRHYGPRYALATVESAAAPCGLRSWSLFSICPRYPTRIPVPFIVASQAPASLLGCL